VGSGTRRTDPSKTAAIGEVRDPHRKTELRRILGLFGYFREYVPNFAEKAKPLTDLTSKGVSKRLPWTSDHHRALEELKQALIDAVQKPL